MVGARGTLVSTLASSRIRLPRWYGRSWEKFTGFAFSPDSTIIASRAIEPAVILWETATGAELYTLFGHTKPIEKIVFSPDGRHIATVASDTSAIVWDVTTGEEVCTYNARYNGNYKAIAFAHDGTTLILIEPDGNILHACIVNGDASKRVRMIPSPEPYFTAILSLDGSIVVIAKEKEKSLLVYDTATGKQITQIPYSIPGWWNDLVASPVPVSVVIVEDKKYVLLQESMDHKDRALVIYDANTGKLIWQKEHVVPLPNSTRYIENSPTSRRLLVRDFMTNDFLGEPLDTTIPILVSPDGNLFITNREDKGETIIIEVHSFPGRPRCDIPRPTIHPIPSKMRETRLLNQFFYTKDDKFEMIARLEGVRNSTTNKNIYPELYINHNFFYIIPNNDNGIGEMFNHGWRKAHPDHFSSAQLDSIIEYLQMRRAGMLSSIDSQEATFLSHKPVSENFEDYTEYQRIAILIDYMQQARDITKRYRRRVRFVASSSYDHDLD